MLLGKRHRLFDVDVFTGFERGLGHRIVHGGGRDESHGVNRKIGQNLVERVGGLGLRIEQPLLGQRFGGAIA